MPKKTSKKIPNRPSFHPSHNHLEEQDREYIQESLNQNLSYAEMARHLHKDPSTLSKEVLGHRVLKPWLSYHLPHNVCASKIGCKTKGLCQGIGCFKQCCYCSKCNGRCPDFKEIVCLTLNRAPHVCNGCSRKSTCRRDKYFYSAVSAQKAYRLKLSSSRCGINMSPADHSAMDDLVTPLIRKGQSISHIFASHREEIPCSIRTLYRYTDMGILSIRNIDLPRQVRYKKRRVHKPVSKRQEAYRKGRTYLDYQEYVLRHPDLPVVEMDVVEGGVDGKVLLTMIFKSMRFMLAFLLDNRTEECVVAALDQLEATLGYDLFCTLFPLVLTDNGGEFKDVDAMENSPTGPPRTRVFYCDPYCSYQKGTLEKNHEFIRYIVPKSSPFDGYNQSDITLLVNHINSIRRNELNEKSPVDLAALLLPVEVLEKLGLRRIHPDEVLLKPSLIRSAKK